LEEVGGAVAQAFQPVETPGSPGFQPVGTTLSQRLFATIYLENSTAEKALPTKQT